MQAIRTALEQLRNHLGLQEAWEALRVATSASMGHDDQGALLVLLAAERESLEQRELWTAACAMARLEKDASLGTERTVPILLQLAELLHDRLLLTEEAQEVWEILTDLEPDQVQAASALASLKERAERWESLRASYLEEATGATDPLYQASMWTRVAELDWRFGGPAARDGAVEALRRAVAISPSEDRAITWLQEHYLRTNELAELQAFLGGLISHPDSTVATHAARRLIALHDGGYLQAGELLGTALRVAAFSTPLDENLADRLVAALSEAEQWDELVAFYERRLALATGDLVGEWLQVAMLLWRMLGSPARAESYFDRIREVAPAHPGALAFYEEFLPSEGRLGKLQLVLQEAHQRSNDEQRGVIERRIAALQDQLREMQRQAESLKVSLRENPADLEMRASLKALYGKLDNHSALVELLRQELESVEHTDEVGRVAVLRQIAQVYRTGIRSDTALIAVLSQIVGMEAAHDAQTECELRELCQLFDKLGRHRDLLSSQMKLAAMSTDRGERIRLYREVGTRWLEQFSNAQNAVEAFEALFDLAPEDESTRARLDEIYRKRRAWPQLVTLLEKTLPRLEPTERPAVRLELARLHSERLSQPEQALELLRSLTREHPDHAEALDYAERLAERQKSWALLAELLEIRALSLSGTDLVNVLQKLGAVYSDHLSNLDQAAGAWRRILETQPGHPRALRMLRDHYLSAKDYDGIEALYGSQNDWEGAAEVLGNTADRATDAAEKIELSFRAAQVYETRLSAPDRAFRAYERVLSLQSDNERAASALIPLYEADEKWPRLVPLYEVMLGHATDGRERAGWLRKLWSVSSHRLNDRRSALLYAQRAYQELPEDSEVFELFEQAAVQGGDLSSFVQALELRMRGPESAAASSDEEPSEADTSKAGVRRRKRRRGAEAEKAPVVEEPRLASEELRRVRLRLAYYYATELDRADDAVALLRTVVEENPHDDVAMDTLERLLWKLQRKDALRSLYDLRVTSAEGDEARSVALARWAEQEEKSLQELRRAIELYRRAAACAPAPRVSLAHLSRLLLVVDEFAAAVEVLLQERDLLEGSERAELELRIADLLATRLEREEEAVAALLRALPEPAVREGAIAGLRRLAVTGAARKNAALELASLYRNELVYQEECWALECAVAAVTDAEERASLLQRLADVQEHDLGSRGTALTTLLRAALETPADGSVWDRAERVAAEAGRLTELAEAFRRALQLELPKEALSDLCRRAEQLHAEHLGDPTGAIPYLERLLALNPDDEDVFQRLKRVLTAAERWDELEEIYRQAVQGAEDEVRRMEMLTEVALIAEEIMGAPDKAATYFERILTIDESSDSALRALDRLYTQLGRSPQLAKLIERRMQYAFGEDLTSLRVRFARLKIEVLLDPEPAVQPLEEALAEEPSNDDARVLAEKLLAISSLRPRAALMLEPIYEARDEVQSLVEVLEVRLHEQMKKVDESAAQDPGLVELLQRIAQLRDSRLHDDEGAFRAYSKLLPRVPEDSLVRERLLSIGQRMGRFDGLASVLAQAAKACPVPEVAAELLTEEAKLHEHQLGNAGRAEGVYRSILQLCPDVAEIVLAAARALERIYIATDRPGRLADMLDLQVKHEADFELRGQLLARLGELRRNVLDDDEGAIAAWRARLDEAGDDAVALGALRELYERGAHWNDLVEVLDRLRDCTVIEAERRALAVQVAQVKADRLGALAEAVESWQQVLADFGPEEDALGALEQLLAKTERWEELSEVLQNHLDLQHELEPRLSLLSQLAQLRQEKLADSVGALEIYREALALRPGHEAARRGVESLLENPEASLRLDAAAALLPIYEVESNGLAQLRCIDVAAAVVDDPDRKLELLRQGRDVAERLLEDQPRAFAYAAEALGAAAGQGDLRVWFAEAERLAQTEEQQRELQAILEGIVDEVFDGEVQQLITLRIAQLARGVSRDLAKARRFFERAVEQQPEDLQALSELEALFVTMGDQRALLGVLEQRGMAVDGDDERRTLLLRRGELLAGPLADLQEAIRVVEEALDYGLVPTVIEALEKLYVAAGRFDDLIALYERLLGEGASDSVALLVKMAAVYRDRLGDLSRAIDELERALEQDMQDARAVGFTEEVMRGEGEPVLRARAAALLEAVYLQRTDSERMLESLRVQVSGCDDPTERRALLERTARLQEEQREDYAAAMATRAEILGDDPLDGESQRELERLADLAGRPLQLAAIFAQVGSKTDLEEARVTLSRRAGVLYVQQGKDGEALPLLRTALEGEPTDREVFALLDQLLQRSQSHDERVELYRQALDARFDPEERFDLLMTIASLQEGPLERRDEAIQAYREASETLGERREPLLALRPLYEASAAWSDLAEVQLRLAELAPEPAEEAELRLGLARIYRTRLEDSSRSLEQLEEVVRLVPDHGEAAEELRLYLAAGVERARIMEVLRPLYEHKGDWERIIELNAERLVDESDSLEKVAILKETAQLWEDQGERLDHARRALAAAMLIDAEDEELRLEYERLVELDGAWTELDECYSEVLAKHGESLGARALWERLVTVRDEKLSDLRGALGAARQLVLSAEGEMEPLAQLKELALLIADWPTVASSLTVLADSGLSEEEQAEAWWIVGAVHRDMLEQPADATAAFERAAELRPRDASVLDALIALLDGDARPQDAVDVYRRRVELSGADEQERQHDLLLRSARLLEHQLNDRVGAIEALQQALAVTAGDRGVVLELNRLYEAEQMWPELLDNLRLEAATAATGSERARLRKRIGAIQREQQLAFEESMETFRLVLEDGMDEEAVAAIRAIGTDQEHLREGAISILLPVLQRQGRWAEVIELLEARFQVELSPLQRTETLRQVARTWEEELRRPADAFDALQRALMERPEDASLLDEFERLAEVCSRWADFIGAVQERAQATFEPELGRALYLRVARAAERQGDRPRAIQAFQSALDLVGDDRELMGELERLHSAQGNHRELLELLERSVGMCERPAEYAAVHTRIALLQLGPLKDVEAAIFSLRSALEQDPSHELAAAEATKLLDHPKHAEEVFYLLDESYRRAGTTERLAELYERRVREAKDDEERLQLRRDLARVMEVECHDVSAAQRVIQAALADAPADLDLHGEVERLAGLSGEWAAASQALVAAARSAKDVQLEERLEWCDLGLRWARDRGGDSRVAEDAVQAALELQPKDDALLETLEALQRAPGREAELVETLATRARLQGSEGGKLGLRRDAVETARRAGLVEVAEAVLREHLKEAPKELWALEQLTELRRAAADLAEVVSLLLARASLDGARTLRLEAAELARRELNDAEHATRIYEQIESDLPGDEEVQNALRELYAAADAKGKLEALLGRMITATGDVESRAVLEVERAKLLSQLKRLDEAVELLRSARSSVQVGTEATALLREYLATGKRWEELAALVEELVQSASGSAEELRDLRLGLIDLYDQHLGDRARARTACEGVLASGGEELPTLLRLAELHLADYQLAEAASQWQRALEWQTPADRTETLLKLERVYDSLGEAAKAVDALERAHALAPDRTDLAQRLRERYEALSMWPQLALCWEADGEASTDTAEKGAIWRRIADLFWHRAKEPARAVPYLEKASELDPENRELLLLLCDAYNAGGRAADAVPVLQKVIESYGKRRAKELADVYQRLGEAHLAQGQFEEAVHAMEQAYRMDTTNIAMVRRYGEVALEAKDFKKAHQMFRALLLQRLDEQSPITKAEVFYFVGRAHEGLGEPDKAIQQYERALAADANLAVAQERMAALKS